MWSAFYNLLLGGATPEERSRVWRILVTTVLLVHLAWAWGMVPVVSKGFASVDSVENLQSTVQSIRVKQLLETVEKEKRNVCVHLTDGNTAALDYAVRKRDDLMREYKEVTGESPLVASCIELGVQGSAQ